MSLLSQFIQINSISANQKIEETFSIKGIVLDEETKEYLPNANIVVIELTLNEAVGFDATDSLGRFEVSKLKASNYKLVVSYLGYHQRSDSIKILANDLELGEILLLKTDLSLEEVQVIDEKNQFQFNAEKLTVNVDKVKSSETETVTELLKKVPYVQVFNNRIYLNGNSNLSILINGKRSNMTKYDILDQTYLDRIERIDIITNPSAKYDAAGSGGIIDIILKEEKNKDYLKSKISIGIGTKDNYKGSGSINFRINRLSIWGGYDTRFRTHTGKNNYYRESLVDLYPDIIRSSLINNKNHGHTYKAGLDYEITSDFNIVSSATYHTGNKANHTSFISQSTVNDNLDTQYDLLNYDEGEGEAFEFANNINFGFDSSKQKIDFNIYFSNAINSRELSKEYLNKFPDSLPLTDKITNDNNKNKFFSISSDYSYKFRNEAKLEIGCETVFRKQTADYSQLVYDLTSNSWGMNFDVSNKFTLSDQFYSAYSLYSNSFTNLKYSVGLRIEHSKYEANQVTTNNIFDKSYTHIFPSLHLTYSFSESNTINFSYTRRIDKPYLFMLNPFEKELAADYIYLGNPDINPSIGDKYTLSKSFSLLGTSINSSIYYQNRYDIINNPEELKTNGITYSSPRNNEKLHQIGINISSGIKPFKFWSIFVGGMFSINKLNTILVNGQLGKHNYSFYFFNFNNNIDMWNNLRLQFNFNLISPIQSFESRSRISIYTEVSVNKNFLEDRLNVNLSINNVITNYYENKFWGTNFTSFTKNSPMERILTLSMSYNFNRFRNQRIRKPDEDTGANEYLR